jgi:multimeric flavodoxin WrbA
MNKMYVIIPGSTSERLRSMAMAASEGTEVIKIDDSRPLPDLKDKKLLFAVELDNTGSCLPIIEIFLNLYRRGNDSLSGSSGAVLVHSSSQLYTKHAAQNIIFLANELGCRFPGSPLVEATADLGNLLTWQKKYRLPLDDTCLELCRDLGRRLLQDKKPRYTDPNILALHSSSHETSNTLALWRMIKKGLEGYNITELHVENGTVLDCKGCSYKTCKHYAKQSSCFYGGIMVEEILPAVERADAVVWLCPNYNDSVSANLMAVINRLTVLYRKTKFFDKNIFAVIVSGYSGGDSVAKQLIGALNINKSFGLPPYFSIMATANDPGSIKNVPGIEAKAALFARNISSGMGL